MTAVTSTVSVDLPPIIPVVHASEVPVVEVTETLEGKISRIAREESVSSTTVFNAAKGESTLGLDVIGDLGCSLGTFQINVCAHRSIASSSAMDDDFAIRYFARALSRGEESAWTVCNCYSYIKANFIKGLPKMADIVPNAAPKVGGVIILQYASVKHIAYITNVGDGFVNVREANYSKCATGTRQIFFVDPHLIGFWVPPSKGT